MAKVNSINNSSGPLSIDPGSSGDSFLQYAINSTNEFKVGVDDDDSDKFKTSVGGSLGSNDIFILDSNGVTTKPLQPAFLVDFGNFQVNVTGDGTVYTLDYSFGTEIFDQGSDFDGTSTFTAPITGRYKLSASMYVKDLTGSNSAYFQIVTSNRTYRMYTADWLAKAGIFGIGLGFGSVLCDMDASDTAVVQLVVSGGTKIVDVGTAARVFFSGALVC